MLKEIVIHWFRQDLRISDNPAFYNAAKNGAVLPIYIFNEEETGNHKMGEASRVWLYHSLKSLNQDLKNKLSIYNKEPQEVFKKLAEEYDIKTVHFNRCYEPWRVKSDKKTEKMLTKMGVEVNIFNGSLLWQPWEVLKKDGTPYKVFTPFYKNGCLNASSPREPLGKPEKLKLICDKSSLSIDDLKLLPAKSWDKKLVKHWKIGEESASEKLNDFLSNGLKGYKEGRNYPAKCNVSYLSPHLHFGEISPNQVWYGIKFMGETLGAENDMAHFLSELAWREFSYNLLYYFPEMPHKNMKDKFDNFPWHKNEKYLSAWQKGQTGYPIIDAGMRELWQTGYMHNRVRMVVGSFLVKNLLINWQEGEQWFWDCLLDGDLANNSANWQWIAGCGADASPYFRIFNPVTQGKKFDAKGEYTRKYVPELADLPDKYLFSPWETPEDVLKKAGVKLGKTYPKPIVDLKTSREKALKAFRNLKN